MQEISTKTLTYGQHQDAILLFHGLSSTPMELRPVATQLAAQGYSVEVPFLPGFSYVEGETIKTSWEKWYAQAKAYFLNMRQRYRSVRVGGLCIGAVLALKLAAEMGEDVRAVVLYSPTLYYDGWSIPALRRLLPIAYYTPLRYFWYFREREPFGVKNLQLRKWIAREMAAKSSSIAGAAKLPMTGIYQAERLIKSVKKDLNRIDQATLIIHARDDDVASLASPALLQKDLRARSLRTVILANSYHMITIDSEREIVARETIAFLRDIDRQAEIEGAEHSTPLPKQVSGL